jgi:hypothetical protein
MIPKGTELTFTAIGSTGEWIPRSPDDVRSGVIRALSDWGGVSSVSITVTSGLPIIGSRWDWGYTSVVRLTTRYAHGSIADLEAIVRGAYHAWTGEIPTVSTRGFSTQDPAVDDTRPGVALPIMLTVIGVVGVAVFVWRSAG